MAMQRIEGRGSERQSRRRRACEGRQTYVGDFDLVAGLDGPLGSQDGLAADELNESVGDAGVIGHGERGLEEDADLAEVCVVPVKGVGLNLLPGLDCELAFRVHVPSQPRPLSRRDWQDGEGRGTRAHLAKQPNSALHLILGPLLARKRTACHGHDAQVLPPASVGALV